MGAMRSTGRILLVTMISVPWEAISMYLANTRKGALVARFRPFCAVEDGRRYMVKVVILAPTFLWL